LDVVETVQAGAGVPDSAEDLQGVLEAFSLAVAVVDVLAGNGRSSDGRGQVLVLVGGLGVGGAVLAELLVRCEVSLALVRSFVQGLAGVEGGGPVGGRLVQRNLLEQRLALARRSCAAGLVAWRVVAWRPAESG